MNDNQDIIFRLALQPGTTKQVDGKTYVLNENHRWTLPREKDSPGQGSLFDSPREENSDDSFWGFDFRMDLSAVSDNGRNFNKQRLARDKALEEAKEQVRGLTGEIGKVARDKVVSAQIEMIFDDIDNLAAGRVPPGYDQKQFMKFKLFNGLEIELTGQPEDWSNSTADVSALDGLPPHVISAFKERRKRREQGIVRRMAVAANNFKTLIDPSQKPNLYDDFAIGGLDKIKFNPANSVLTEGANGYFSAQARRIGIVVPNCYDSMFSPGKSKTKGFEELNEWFSDVSPEGVMIHELGHAINCDNLYKADLANFARRREVTDFWSAWDETFMSRPFKNNLKSLASSKGETSYTKQLKAAFPDIAKEHLEVSRWISGKTPDVVTPEELQKVATWTGGGFIEYWDAAMKREAGGVSQYARTCPAELVAEMFASPRPMDSFSKELQTYYKLVGGPDFALSNHKRSSSNAA